MKKIAILEDKYKITEGMICIKCETYNSDIVRKGQIVGYICGKCNNEFQRKLKEWNEIGLYLTSQPKESK